MILLLFSSECSD